jgi:membrane protein YqaA with SNARE-associated domain
MAYITLFVISFLSATLLPLGSEALFLYDISQEYSVPLLWSVATFGNTLGSMFNYWVGLKGEAYLVHNGHLSFKKMDKSRRVFDTYGGWTLLLSWVPIMGDPLTLVAGMLRYKFKYFILIVFVAKGLRYAALIFLASSLSV